MLTQQIVKELFNYDPETGILSNAFDRNSRAKKGNRVGSISAIHGYRTFSINNKMYYEHRVIWLYVYGYFPKTIDHINGDKADNRLVNLRKCTQSQNCANRIISKANSSGFKGVTWNNEKHKWKVMLTVNKKRMYLGDFSDKDEARKVYDLNAEKYFGEYTKRTEMKVGI